MNMEVCAAAARREPFLPPSILHLPQLRVYYLIGSGRREKGFWRYEKKLEAQSFVLLVRPQPCLRAVGQSITNAFSHRIAGSVRRARGSAVAKCDSILLLQPEVESHVQVPTPR